jgi:aminopeptidase N
MASVAWDEARFGLALDLDRFMIVAVRTSTWAPWRTRASTSSTPSTCWPTPGHRHRRRLCGIESVVGHEYFHNWTGNRVTCRDWFQLSLKEGLTVFRDQEFSMDMAGSAVGARRQAHRDVRAARAQFPEDAGPMAHPVRPDSY